jgi:hypothetical protein
MGTARLRIVEARHMLPALPASQQPRAGTWVAIAVGLLLGAPIFVLRLGFDKHGRYIGFRGVLVILLGLAAAALQASRGAEREARRRREWRHLPRSVPVRLGADGLALEGDEFVRHGSVVSHERVDGRLVLHVGRTEPVVLTLDPEDWLMVEELLEQAGAGRKTTADAELEAMLRAGAQTRDAYRVAAIDRGRLVKVAVDADAEPAVRVEACARLGTVEGNEERAALRASLAATAHPQVREALQAALGQARVRVASDVVEEEEKEEEEEEGEARMKPEGREGSR